MKTTQPKFLLWPVLAASLIASPLSAQSPDRQRPDGPPPPREEAPNPERLKRVVREMAELHKAGKHEEAKKLSERLREVAKDNPEAARQVFEALRDQRQQAAKPDAPKDAPHRENPPEARREEGPNPERIKHAAREMAELQKAGKHEEARKISERLKEAGKNNPEAARQIAEILREQRQQAPKPDAPKDILRPRESRPPAPPQARQAPMPPPTPQPQPHAMPAPMPPPQAMPNQHGRWQAQPGRTMPTPNVMPNRAHWPQGPMPMARQHFFKLPQATAPGQSQRPNIAAARDQVSKLRHLNAAAGHLAAAGYPEYAAKAREEAGRIGSALKQQMPKPQAPMLQSREPRQARPATPRPEAAKAKCPMQEKMAEAKKEAAKKEAAKKDVVKKEAAKKEAAKKEAAKKEAAKKDEGGQLLKEMQKLNKQMSDLNSRVRKLEKEGDDD